MANPSDWAQLYSHTFAKQETPCREDRHPTFIMSDQISSTTTGMAANSLSSTGSHMVGTNNMMSSSAIRENFHLSYTPDGRVSKPSRKRTRVSAKKDHTTILNTDISNFRAMVQQFTGAPQSAFLSTSSLPGVNLSANYSMSTYDQQAGHQLHPYQQQQQQQQQQLMMQLLNNNNRNEQGLDIGVSNVNKLHARTAAKMEKSDGFVIADGNSSTFL
ncbi:VQ motif-containing protein 22-like [Papaver somniferum]|uniref:VQ motif-containing protein 22-like n=1 Tax=Papaver somniferum TaxID=3469 RepID=UPI000E6F8453|nr:VQ motif-containing protein 22-like [Papaver somniferum]